MSLFPYFLNFCFQNSFNWSFFLPYIIHDPTNTSASVLRFLVWTLHAGLCRGPQLLVGYIMRKNTTKIETKEQGLAAQTASRDKPSTSATDIKVRQARPSTPFLGLPIGLDDWKRKDPSRAGVRLYLRYLKQGLKPEEVRAKVDQHMQERQKVIPVMARTI